MMSKKHQIRGLFNSSGKRACFYGDNEKSLYLLTHMPEATVGMGEYIIRREDYSDISIDLISSFALIAHFHGWEFILE